jgi:hypothetical protein
MQEKYEVAETFFDRVTCKENENVIAWCLYGMFYEQTQQDLNAEITFNKTLALDISLSVIQLQQQAHLGSIGQIKEEDEATRVDEDAIIEEATIANKPSTIEAISKSRISKRTSTNQLSKFANSTKLTPKSPAVVLNSTGGHNKSPRSPSNSGQISSKQNEDLSNLTLAATHSTQSYTDSSFLSVANKSIYTKTAIFLAEYNAFVWAEKFLAKELLNPKGGPNCEFHLLLTRIKIARNELVEAEKHCTSALAFDYQVFRYKLLICLEILIFGLVFEKKES